MSKPQRGEQLSLRFAVVDPSISGRLRGVWFVRLPNNQEMQLDFGSDDNPNTGEIITTASLVVRTWYAAQPQPKGEGPFR